MDERAFIDRFAQASPDELVRLVNEASLQEQEALGAYLGTDRLQRLRHLSARSASPRGQAARRGRVIFVPGFLGSSLSVSVDGQTRPVWLDRESIRHGWFQRLRLAVD